MNARFTVRMIAPIAVTSLLLLTVGGVAAWYLHRLQRDISDLLAHNVASVRAAEEIEIDFRQIRSQLKDYQYTGDRRFLGKVEAIRPTLMHWVDEAARLATTEREQLLVARLRRGVQLFGEELERLTGPEVGPGPPGERLRTLIDGPIPEEIFDAAQQYLDLNEDIIAETSRQNQQLAGRLVLVFLLLGTCGAVAGLVAGYGLARGVSRSMVQLSLPIRDAAGKLSEVVGPVTLDAGGDFPQLEAALQRLADQAGAVVERLQHSQREVLRSEQLAAVGQMAAGLAHELRNPLMAMKLLVQPGGDGPAETLSSRDLAVLDEEVGRLESAIQTFLDFARPPQPEKRPFDARPVVEQAVQRVAARADSQGVRIDVVAGNEPLIVEADVSQFRQVLLNLLLNALDAVAGGGLVRVTLDRDGRDWLRLRVADSGPGLPPALGPRIFEPFVSTKETGMGLGLSICKRIVEAHGGELAAADRPVGGAVFTVSLPPAGRPRPAAAAPEERCDALPADRR
jgi:signal transduction histidine kinase